MLIDKSTGNQIPPEKVPDTFNTHLCTIASTLTCKFANVQVPFYDTISTVMEELLFSPITVNEVFALIKGIEIHKSSAIGKISSKLLKDSLEVLAPQLTHLYNCSITTSIFPDKWKTANVVLIHKGGNKNDVNNFRPISLLPIPGKMFEKLMHGRILDHLEKNDILTDVQWGFRPT